MRKVYAIKAISFILVFAILLSVSTAILQSKWINDTSTTYVQEGLYDLEENTVELCFLGNSQMIYGVSSMLLLENYGISAYNAATGLQPMLCTYFNLKEIHKTQDISTVVLDIGGIYEKTEDAKYRMVFDCSPLSLNKLQAIWAYCSNNEQASDFWSYIFPIMKYHSRWNDLSKKDFKYDEMNEDVFRGNRLYEGVFAGIEYDKVIVDYDEAGKEAKMLEEHLKYFRKVAEYCEDNGINLVLIKTPKTSWSKAKMQGVQELADEYGLDYIDFNKESIFNEVGFDVNQDFKDPDHLSTRGTEKLTNYLGEYLLSRYDFQDARTLDSYDAKMTEAFYRDYTNKYVTTSISVGDILDCMNNERYEILIEKSGEIAGNWSDELQAKLEKLGVKQDMRELQNMNYVAYLSGKQTVYEETAAAPLEYKGTLSNGSAFTVKSDVTNFTDKVAIMLDGSEIVFGIRGLNILVYDKELGKIVRYFNIYLDGATNEIMLN